MSSGSTALSPEFLNAAYLRVASMAIGAYEFLCTLPAEYRFYRSQSFVQGFSQQFLLFTLVRYLSVTVITVSNVGFFGRFSPEGCRRFMLVSPIFKVLQTMASQLILSTRTYTISRKARWVLWIMSIMFIAAVPLEFYANISQRSSVSNTVTHNCTSGNKSGHRVAWINYVVAMIFDLVAICISTVYLWSYRSTATRISHFIHTLLYEGLGYFVVLTAVNVFNLILYHNGDETIQSSGASLGYVIIFIMSQRILIKQRDYAEKYATSDGGTATSQDVSKSLDTSQDINRALRSQFETQKSTMLLDTFGVSTMRSQRTHIVDLPPDGIDVRVRVERSVVVENNREAFLRENYRKPRVLWDSKA